MATASQPLPAPIKALRASLRGTREPEARDRISATLKRVETLYGLRSAPLDDADTVATTRRRQFAGARHNMWAKNKL
jgi:hypothetical protein